MYVPQGPARKRYMLTPRRRSGEAPKPPSDPAQRATGKLTFAPTGAFEPMPLPWGAFNRASAFVFPVPGWLQSTAGSLLAKTPKADCSKISTTSAPARSSTVAPYCHILCSDLEPSYGDGTLSAIATTHLVAWLRAL